MTATKITTIGSHELTYISRRVRDALKALETELGVSFSHEGGQYGSKSHLKLGVMVTDVGNGKSSMQVAFERMAQRIGLKPEWFGVRFYVDGSPYRIIGVNPGRPKNVLSIENIATGKQYVCGPNYVRMGLEVAAARPATPGIAA